MLNYSTIADPKPIPIYKSKGLTPLDAVNLYATKRKIDPGQRLGYAGRLDPLADGVLLALIGSANKLQTELLAMDKHYRFTALFNITTDSYDLMGIPEFLSTPPPAVSSVKAITEVLIGDFEQPYPPYSAVQVGGRPLYWWARAGKLAEVTIPSKIRRLFSLRMIRASELNNTEIMATVEHDISLAKGDFRQKEIIEAWRSGLSYRTQKMWMAVEFAAHCSSGTYIRGIVHEIGQRLGCGATAVSITRTAVGSYTLKDCYYLSM